MSEKLSKNNQSVEKTMRIVEVLAQANAPMRLSVLAKLTDLPASTALRMVNTLVNCGYAYQEEDGAQGYGLTMRFLRIGQQVAENFGIRDLAHSYLLKASRELGETCCLSVKERDVVFYVDVVENSRSVMRIRQRIGDTVPMHCTATGKLFLTQYSDEQLVKLTQAGLARRTARTLISESALRYDLKEIAQRGYAVDDEECEEGMYCVAAPICDINGIIIAAICISGPIYRMTQDRVIHEILPKLKRYAGEIEDKINGRTRKAEEEVIVEKQFGT